MSLVLNLYRYRQYILQNAWHDLRIRYAGSGMGIVWNVLLPLLEVIIFTTVFSQIMSMRGSDFRASYGYILYLCSGLFPWFTFAGTVTRGGQSFHSNARYLTKLPIPEEIFVAKFTVVETFILVIYLVLLVVVGPILGQPLGWANLLLPVVGILFQLLGFGLALLLSSLTIFFRDISHVLSIIMRLWLWLTPIIYLESMLSPRVLAVFRWNPAFFYVKSFRELFLENQIPTWTTWSIMVAWAAGFILLGYFVLQKLRPEIRDVL